MEQDETSREVLLQARNAVYRLLKVRMRSEKEVRDRLKLKNYPPHVIDQTVLYFQESALIDDREFAKRWISERLHKPLGFKRIRFELKNKGVAPDLYEDLLTKADYSEETAVRALLQKKTGRSRRTLDKQKRRKQMQDYLLRKGFEPKVVYKAVKDI